MVDVVFVLMLFFMACAGMQVVEKELSINIPQRTSEGCVFDANPCSAHKALEAAFFTQPTNRLSMTLPAFRASRVDLDIVE